MVDSAEGGIWIARAAFVLLASVVILLQLVPLDLRPQAFAGPDFLLAATLVWVARAPAALPVMVVAVVFLLADLLFMRPPGLWAALVVALTEVIRRQNSELRDMPFMMEWATVASGVIAITLINRAVLFILAVPPAPLGLSLIEMIMTILAYPVMVLVAFLFFGIRKAAPGETGHKGQLV